MLDVFLTAVLPVFMVIVFGVFFGKRQVFDFNSALIINRLVFYFGLPALLFGLVSTAKLSKLDWSFVGGFLAAELFAYLLGFLVSRYVFSKSFSESLLLGMATAFANQVFFILPIARELYGDEGAFPVILVSVFDVMVLLAGTIILMEIRRPSDNAGWLQKLSRIFLKNPPIMAIAVGLIVNLSGISLHEGISFFLSFTASIAAPASLFALGVILALSSTGREYALPIVVTVLKLGFLPFVAWALLSGILQVPDALTLPSLLVAAGPAGAMPFVLAMQYGVEVHAIARAILYSTIGSLVTVTVVLQMI